MNKIGILTAAIVCLTFTVRSNAQQPEQVAARTHVVVVVGAAGTPEYGEQFELWANNWRDVAVKAAASLTLIGQSESDDESDRAQLQAAIDSLPADDRGPLWLVFIGHGTYARNTAKFNLRGPDVSATELAQWLKHVERPIVVVNCASASGPFINRLSGKDRIVVTATKSGTEQNYARFGEFMSKAIASADSDLDHDDEVSVHEAFLRASAEVRRFYEEADRISTEHALIDDNGDQRGTPATLFRGTRPVGKAKDGAKLDGREASRMTLTPADARLPFTQAELKERLRIENELDKLRQRKSALSEEAYDANLEPLMLELARLYQTVEQRMNDAERL